MAPYLGKGHTAKEHRRNQISEYGVHFLAVFTEWKVIIVYEDEP